MKDKLIASERMKDFYNDIKHWVDYDFVVINDDLNRCFEEINVLIEASLLNKKNNSYNKSFIENHVKNLLN